MQHVQRSWILDISGRRRSGNMEFDLEKIRAAGYSTTTAVLLTNSDDFSAFRVLKTGKADRMEPIFTVEETRSN